MNPLAKKLLIRPGAVVRVIGAPAGAGELLTPLPPDATRVDVMGVDVVGVDARASGKAAGGDDPSADVVLAFVQNTADLVRLAPVALAAVRPDGVLWIAYRKGGTKAGTDLNRDVLHDALAETHDWTGVSLVAVDAQWSAMRFRPRAQVGT